MKPVISPKDNQQERAKLSRELVTPEGIPIRFTLAPVGERAAALIIDLVIQIVALMLIELVVNVAGASGGSFQPLMIILSFLILNFYFSFFEIRWQGATPGKRKLGIRVIDARGGQLETSAVLARNLVRELEIWTPLRFLIMNSILWPDAPQWALLLAGAWTFVFMLMPLFNKDKLRVGDLIGGTRVVMQPKTVLLPDLVSEAAHSMQMRAQAAPTYAFTDKQLAVYGIYELQVLEGVLRQDPAQLGYWDAVTTVAEKIQKKIEYRGRIDDTQRFLKDFYVALRGHLEQKMLFGQRKEDKYAVKKK